MSWRRFNSGDPDPILHKCRDTSAKYMTMLQMPGMPRDSIDEKCSARGFDILPDGAFGAITRGILIDFQATNGLKSDVVTKSQNLSKLGLT